MTKILLGLIAAIICAFGIAIVRRDIRAGQTRLSLGMQFVEVAREKNSLQFWVGIIAKIALISGMIVGYIFLLVHGQ